MSPDYSVPLAGVLEEFDFIVVPSLCRPTFYRAAANPVKFEAGDVLLLDYDFQYLTVSSDKRAVAIGLSITADFSFCFLSYVTRSLSSF